MASSAASVQPRAKASSSKGSNFLEGLNAVKTVVMDKTGTLTEGKFAVTRIESAGDLTENRLLELTAYAEMHSSHPIADSIEAYGKTIAEEDYFHK